MDNTSNSHPLPSSFPSFSWRETESGEFIPTLNYEDTFGDPEGEALNEIEWKKVKIAKSGLVKGKGLQVGDTVYHRAGKHYLKIINKH